MAVATTPIRFISSRKILLFGCDRELVLTAGAITIILIVSLRSWLTAFVGVGVWFLSVWGLRLMAKADPFMRHIIVRYYKKYRQDYYPPRSTPFHINKASFSKRFY